MTRYIHPTAVRHQGRGVLIAEKIETNEASGTETRSLVFNILALNPDIADDGLGWQGFGQMPTDAAQQTSLAGYSVLRVLGVDESSGPMRAVSDETHIYLFRPDRHTLLVERFLLVETSDPNARDGRGFTLIADWEVRFRRSASPDLPASANDVAAYKDVDGAPFLDPRRYLAFAPGTEALDLSQGFAPLLLPTAEAGRLQWRLYARSQDGTTLYSYAIPRLADGWFDLGAATRDARGLILPISSLKLALDQEGTNSPMRLSGYPAAALYQRLEPMIDAQGGAVQMRTANRIFLACPAALAQTGGAAEDGSARLLALDFQVDGNGSVAYDAMEGATVLAGLTDPEALCVDFSLPAFATIAKPVPGSASFTVQMWLCPQRGPVSEETAGEPRRLLWQSGAVDPIQRGLTVEIVDQFRVRVSFGNGAEVVSAITRGNILSYGSWVNVSIVQDGAAITLYLNGARIELDVTGTPGAAPAGTVDRIGAHEGGYVGQLTELRLWSRALSEAEIRENMLAPLPEPSKAADLAAYWPMDGGTGTDIADLSGHEHGAQMQGAVWFQDAAPLARPNQAINQIDPLNRALSASWLNPSLLYPGFGPVQADSRPTVLPSGDGPIHLYYSGLNRRFTVARRSAVAQRAFFVGGWTARDSGGSPVETGRTVFTTRQTGGYNSFTTIDVKPGASGLSCELVLEGPNRNTGVSAALLRKFLRSDSSGGTQETWRGLPRQLGRIEPIVDGRAVPDPSDARVAEGRAVYYDYAGRHPQVLLALGDEALLSGLRFVTTLPDQCLLAGIQGEPAGDDIVITARLTSAGGKAFSARFGVVPRVAESVISLLRGTAPDEAYAPNDASTPAWGLPSRSTHLFVLAPRMADGKPAVLSAKFGLTAGDTLETATFAAELVLSTGTLQASWANVPRKGSDFIAAIEAGSTPEQRAVLAELFFIDRTQGALLNADQVQVDTRSDLRYVTAFLAAFREGQGGTLPDKPFDLNATLLQGVSGAPLRADATVASALVSLQAMTLPQSGYPASVDYGSTQAGSIVLGVPGRDGGWLRDPPRYAETFNGTSALEVELSTLVPAPDVYEVPGAVSIEGWIQPAESQRLDNSADVHQSVLHYSASETGLSYGLGFTPVETPRFFEQVQFAFSDANVPAGNTDDRLVRDGRYTVHLYLRPSLLSAGRNWFWKRQKPDNTGPAETLSINALASAGPSDPPANWRLVFTTDSGEIEAPLDLPGNRWTLVTLVRDGASAALYLNGELAIQRSDLAQPTISPTGYVIANPRGNAIFEFDPNEFAAWNTACSAQEIRDRYLRPLTGAEPGLVALFPLSRKEDGARITNSARWTTTLYDTSFAGNPFFTTSGLFFDLVANYGARTSGSATPALAPGRWQHVAAVLNRRGALALASGQSAAANGKKESRLGRSFTVDARIVLSRLGGARQVIAGRFGAQSAAQLYEFGVRQDGLPYVTVRLRPAAGGRLSSPNQGLVTILAASEHRIQAGDPHHIAATVSIRTVNDSESRRDVTALSGEVFVDGLGNAPIFQPGGSNLGDYRLVTVIGGSGSGYYREGQTVTIETYDPAHFTRWYGTMADLGAFNNKLPKTTFVMPSGAKFTDLTLAARAFIDPVQFADPATPTQVGQSGAGPSTDGAFSGQISDLRLWAEALGAAEVAELAAQPGASPFDDKLISWWPFAEQSGRLAKDAVSGNDLTLSSSRLWTWFDGAEVAFYIGGLPMPSVGLALSPFRSTPRQMRIGAIVKKASGEFGAALRGQIDELRLWQGQRTREQVLINMSRYLTGAEPELLGYWRFDAGSGDVVADRTVHRGDAHCFDAAGKPALIGWTLSGAPIGFDAPIVNDALDTRPSPEAVELSAATATTTVFEYGDTLTLPDGTVQGVLKRSYVYEGISGLDDETGYKVGDLVRTYIGQIQTDPSVIGYIEGAPPLPSENLTRPLTDASSVDSYCGLSSVTLTDQSEQTVTIGSGSESSEKDEFKISIGGAGSLQKDEVIGIPPIQSAIQSAKFELKLGVQITGSFESKSEASREIKAGAQRSTACTMANGGLWEQKTPEGTYFLDSGERRFVPGNVGSAVVKSQVADLYALRVPSTGALVSLSAEPNPDIPIDVNIIRFPIDPLYQLAGSLDGRIGLQKAPMTDTSYFRPRAAYTLKRQVEQQRQRLKAYYEQTQLQSQLGLGADLTAVTAANPLFSADLGAPVRDMVNTYVWSAGGGTYAESEGYSTELTETYALGRSQEIGVGGNLSVFFTVFGVGITIEGEYSHTFGKSFSTTKSFARSRALQLEVEAAPDAFPFKYDDKGEFLPERVPGKVDGYRFMSFFLSNRSEHANELFEHVIDQAWLKTSRDPDAAALRQASLRSGDMAPWRVMHHVTFVSRIPPRFQAVPDLTDKAATPEPPNQTQNALFLSLVRSKLPKTPSPADISAAVSGVLTEDLQRLLPWWKGFLDAAAIANSQQQQELRKITSNSIAYALSVLGAH